MSDPPTPPSQEPTRMEDWRFRDTGIACEWAESYRPSGFHPVHFGDVFNGRYEVIRKLGDGSFSTVWLAADSVDHRYVVLKVGVAKREEYVPLPIHECLMAQRRENADSQFVVQLLDRFIHDGPNGKHPCLVLETMGPSVSAVLNNPWKNGDVVDLETITKPRRFSKDKTKAILRHVLRGLGFLHSNEIVHGDLQSGNMLFAIRDLKSVAVEELRQRLEDSDFAKLERVDGKVDKWAPKYLVVEEPLDGYLLPDDEAVVKIIDLESAFFESDPPPRIVTPVALRAPESILGGPVGRGIDIWSFGCLVFELLTGMPLFQLPIGKANAAFDDDHLIQLTEIISPLPPGLLCKWTRAERYFGPNGERLDASPYDLDEASVSGGESDGEFDDDEDFEEDDLDFPRENFGPPRPFDSLEKMFRDNKPDDIDEEEEKVILSMLRWILQHEASKRPSVAALLQHDWFRG